MARLILFNEINIRKKVGETLRKPRYEGFARNAANTRLIFAKEAMLEEFDESEVTSELQDGEEADSDILSRGNLFSFLGFYEGTDPTTPVREMLESTRLLSKSKFFMGDKQVTYEFQVKAPSLEDIYKATPMPDDWNSRSWVDAIENGIGTFASYIYHVFINNSRSGTGIQSKGKIGGKDTIPKTKYISKILKNFAARFKT
jgi:hypothetical protein